jgi:hypothetical protein
LLRFFMLNNSLSVDYQEFIHTFMWVKLISIVVFLTIVLSASAFGLEEMDLGSNRSLIQTDLPEISQSLMKLADQAMIYVEENGKDRALEELNQGRD